MTRAQIKIRFRKDRGLWEVDYRDAGGVRRRPLFADEERALARAAEIRRDLRGTTAVAPDRDITLAEYAEGWLATVAGELEASTWQGYRDRLRNHILPVLGRLKLRDLRRRRVKALLNAKRAAGYAPNGVRLIKAALSSMLTDAVDDELIDSNPALQVGRKKRRAGTVTAADRIQKIKPMNWEQRTRLLDAARREPRYATLFAVLAKAGLRPGEALALQPGDVDLRDRTLTVERAVNLGRVKSTKTYERRTVDLSPELARQVQALRWLKEEALRRGWGEPTWLFPNDAGKPQDKWVLGTAFRRTLKRAQLPAFRLYDLRAHLREPAPGRRRADHLREPAARAREPDDDAPLLREVDSVEGPTVGRRAGRRGAPPRAQFWNQNLEPSRSSDEDRRASGGKTW
ncbi:MAG: tyrosine-type recombinase/integrase [Candidatus Rokubacteria bacterium]|nr:tyrosine-type recombinase/integrase [Candidatus Rokubacteria bacterium]